VSYDPSIYRCELGELIGKCRGLDYYVAYERCVDGVVVDNNSNNASSSSSTLPPKSSSSVAVSSSSSKPSSSSVTYTLNCVLAVEISVAGAIIQPPIAVCNGRDITDDLIWTGTPNAPDWNNLVAGTYTNISVQANSGDCNGKIATCNGTLKVQSGIIYDTPVTYYGETYETVVIGTQTWFKRNLNYAISGSKCGNGSSLSDANTTTCNTYGRLYNWATAMALDASCNNSSCGSQVSAKHRGICPEGWHIPSITEWDTLTGFISRAGANLKARNGWNNNDNGTDAYGFMALPGGYGSGGSFYGVGNDGYWLSSSEQGPSASGIHMYYVDYVGRVSFSKSGLVSVRCVQD